MSKQEQAGALWDFVAEAYENNLPEPYLRLLEQVCEQAEYAQKEYEYARNEYKKEA